MRPPPAHGRPGSHCGSRRFPVASPEAARPRADAPDRRGPELNPIRLRYEDGGAVSRAMVMITPCNSIINSLIHDRP